MNLNFEVEGKKPSALGPRSKDPLTAAALPTPLLSFSICQPIMCAHKHAHYEGGNKGLPASHCLLCFLLAQAVTDP